MYLERQLMRDIEKHVSSEEITLVTGSRQVGKTTLLKQIQKKLEQQGHNCFYYNLEIPRYLKDFDEDPENLLKYIDVAIEKRIYVLIDEIQYLKDPSMFLKLLYDEYRDGIKLIVTGSSAFYIDEKFKDSLAGRKRIFNIRPLSFFEFVSSRQGGEKFLKFLQIGAVPGSTVPLSYIEKIQNYMQEYIIYGGYPQVVKESDKDEKQALLFELTGSFIKKDILDSNIRKSTDFMLVLELLASRNASLLNVSDVSNTLKLSIQTVNRFLYVLEKSFHISYVRPFFSNYSKELVKMPKVYFQDNGFLNALINNFSPTLNRLDKGMLLENICYQQLRNHYRERDIKFWHTKGKREIDFILQGKEALEVKYNASQFNEKKYKLFKENYPDIPLHCISFDKMPSGIAAWEI